jgi:UDP-N-acetylglucosamine--N-acetylmuramyl-(pentapeptide) pyrophosphoryl-undecaprenol N-acetylglucosamine transferase
MLNTESPLIALAAGGTGGHVFPAEALARELMGRGLRVALLTDKRGTAFSDDLGVPVHRIRSGTFSRNLFGNTKSLVDLALGYIQANRLLSKLKPAAVVGFGGYPSVPPLYAAARMSIPIILHEQNAVLGRANRDSMKKARLVALSFPHTSGLKPGTGARIIHTGNPVRPAFAAMRATPYTPITDDSAVRLLILGGSLGAKVFSQVVPKAIALLPEHLRSRLMVAQQCRDDDHETTQAAYAGAGIEAELSPFFHDIPERMAGAHLVIGRSGGGAIAELTAIGRPSILVPFPHARAGEQVANAEALAEAGGAWLIPEQAFTPESLAVRLEALLTLPSSLIKAAAAARAWGTVTAADNLANGVEEVIKKTEN